MNRANYYRLCRLCLNNSFFYMHIYVGQSGESNPLYKVLNYVYDLEVFCDDRLPEYICRDCLVKLKEFEVYKRNVHKAKSELLNFKRNERDVSIITEEIDEREFTTEQNSNEKGVKIPSEGGNSVLPDEVNDSGLEQEQVKEEYLHDSSEDGRLENLDQDGVPNNQEQMEELYLLDSSEDESIEILEQDPNVQEHAEDKYIHDTLEDESVEILEQDNVPNIQEHSILDTNQELTKSSTSVTHEKIVVRQENYQNDIQTTSEEISVQEEDSHPMLVEKKDEEITIEEGLPHMTNRMDDLTQPLASEKIVIRQENYQNDIQTTSEEISVQEEDSHPMLVEKQEEEITIEEGFPHMTNRMDDSTQPLASEVLDRVQCSSRSCRFSRGMDTAVVENYFGHTSTGHFGLKRKGSMKEITSVKVRTNGAENFSECNAPSENFKSCDSIPFGYHCEICGMRFKTSEGRTVHESIHLKVNRASKTYSKGSSIKRNSLSPQRNTDVNSLNPESLHIQILVRNSEESHGNLKELVSKESCIQPSPSAVNASQVHTKNTTLLGQVVNRYPIQENISTNLNNSVTSSLNSSVFDTLSTTFEFIHVPDQNLVVPKIRVFSCRFCKKYFSLKKLLNRHMLVHTEKNPKVCNECGECMETTHCRLDHELKHLLEKDSIRKLGGQSSTKEIFCCAVCGNRYTLKESLRKHLNSHISSFSCSTCGKCFAHKDNLKEHVMIHSGEKPCL